MRPGPGRLLAAAALASALAAPAPAPAQAPTREIDCPALLVHVKSVTSLLERAKLLDVAAAKCPQDAPVAYEHAFALERLRRYPEALVAYRTAAELDPAHAKAHVGVADTLMLLGDTAGAVAAYERGLKLDPANARAGKALEVARIKARAQRGEDISSDEFVRVMSQAEVKGGPAESAEGPMVRMQILFKLGAASLDESSLGKLAVVGEALRRPALAGARLEIAGHTDDTGDPEANLALSRRRAEAVRDRLASRHQIPADRLVVAWFGQGRPLAPNTSPRNQQLNRRVEFRLLK
ncbi:MAG: OmpA family protein [Anaeromyxobacter sp.]|nr:OmpA family protein [Anaeromyxobacter sp.]MBL0277737.1 OmpA family protein [Anaeromyxobacter sp.]